MTKVPPPDTEIEQILDHALAEALRSSASVPTQAKISRARWFGISCLFLGAASFCIAAIPWLGKGIIDIATWVVYGFCLLLVGAHFIDKASRDEERAERMMQADSLTLSSDGRPTLRVVK